MSYGRDYSSFKESVSRSISRFDAVVQANLVATLLHNFSFIFADLDAMAKEIASSDPTKNSELRYETSVAPRGNRCLTLTVTLKNPEGEQTKFALGLWENSIGTEDAWIIAQSSGGSPKFQQEQFDELRGLLEGRILAWYDRTAA